MKDLIFRMEDKTFCVETVDLPFTHKIYVLISVCTLNKESGHFLKK